MRNFFSFLILLSLCSCGFQVMYRDEENNRDFSEDLAAIRIKKDRDKLSQELKNNLYDALNPDYITVEPKYLLILRTSRALSGALVTQTGASGRNRVTVESRYELKNLENGATISRGYTTANDNYDVSTNRYGTYVADDTVQLNLTKVVAQNLRNALANDLIEVKKKCSGEIKVEDEEYEVLEDTGNLKGQQLLNPMNRTGIKVVKEKFVCPFYKLDGKAIKLNEQTAK